MPPGAALILFSTCLTTWIYNYHTFIKPQHLDAPPPSSSAPQTPPPEPKSTDLIATGTSTVPFFPRTIHLPPSSQSTTTAAATTTTATRTLPYGTSLPSSSNAEAEGEEYHLLGLGLRRVSFLRIQVYVVGLYISTRSLPHLQEALVRAYFTSSASGDSVASAATTLVENEKEDLKELLLSSDTDSRSRGAQIWNEILKNADVDSVLRIVPTRATDFGHMREGWVRSIIARSGPPEKGGVLTEQQKQGIERSVGDFKAIFGGGRKGVGKGKVLMMRRDGGGEMGVWAEDDDVLGLTATTTAGEDKTKEGGRKGEMRFLGGVKDERVSRLVWLGYLAGGNVASEDARKSVVDGVMEIVERPIGTVETQVI
ncbi:MAG: hypothetical protein Q9220_006052 [cf. Caloplaca sp. 1 TL-2023]